VFDVETPVFKEALYRFADFLADPLLNRESMSGEIQVVDSGKQFLLTNVRCLLA